MSATGQVRYDRYAAAKTALSEALSDYLTAVVEIGGDDAASSLELARQLLIHDLHTAVDKQVSTVPLTDVWAELARKDHAGERSERGGA